MTDPGQAPKSTGAQQWTAVMMTPVGIIAALILLPIVLCCAFDAVGSVVGQFRH